ncbi:hypothetical protein LB518_14970 [Mesorhizobium sp. BR1-1-16]|uniref:hypothetical protein n=1 Tax=Mesorhizobium sp. BR1-1-16 TaxID=2876653 RepID=UPI001CCE7A14|nr:hypothetical protein [Mesorhizobium sp. BR1-1-16]MBZ9937604.1 hypothetical protein [Mesorhizobium sp. BR1-1-16]
MRHGGLIIAAGAMVVASLPADAQSYVGTPLATPALQAAIIGAVAARLPDPAAARIRDLAPSLARNGRGYCGKASADATAAFQPFHIIADDDGSFAVLILPASGDPPGLARADAVHLLTDLGCLR